VYSPLGDTHDLTGRSVALPRTERTALLTVSLEDYFQVGAFGSLIPRGQWYRFESRIERTAARMLDLLDEHDARATVFVLGVVAEQFPELVRAVRERGHEVASKGYQHRPIGELAPGPLADDLARAREAIERATGERVLGCRVSGWLTPRDDWALDVIAEQGYVYDSSMRPLLRSHAAAPATTRAHLRPTRSGLELWELPVSSASVLGFALPVAGGNWMRQLPPALVRRAIARSERKSGGAPLVFYFHSWELDADQPKIDAASPLTRLRHYRNLHRMPERLRQHLAERRFVSARDWLDVDAAPATPPERSGSRQGFVTPARAPALVPAARSLPRVAVTVVIPCFNEERALPYLANTLRRLEDSIGGAYDLRFLLVDDGSTDATRDVMRTLFGQWANVTALHHDRNRGLAAAIQTGVRAATTEIVCSMDCDCTYDPHELARMIPRLRPGVDLVVASPYHADGSARTLPIWRRALATSLARLYRAALRQPLTCYTSSFRVYRRSRILAVTVRRGGFIGVTEMLARLDLDGATIVEHPVTLDARLFGRPRLAIVRGVVDHVGLLAELAWRRLVAAPPRSSLVAGASPIDRARR
jgi:polysaccharide deacetylase family protein (PEP-CTERM system associated)